MTRFPSQPKIVIALEKEDAAKIMAQLNAPEHKIDELYGKIVELVWTYKSSCEMYQNWPAKKVTMQRALQIHQAAKKLQRLLEDEWYEYRLMRGSRHYFDKAGSFVSGPDVFLDILATVEKESAQMLDGKGYPVGLLTRKSVERHLLWDPLIHVWAAAGRRVAYSSGGPLERFISAVHSACRLSAPSGPSLRQAVAEWRSTPPRCGCAGVGGLFR